MLYNGLYGVMKLSDVHSSNKHGIINEPYIAMTYILYLVRSFGGKAKRSEIDSVVAIAGRLNYFFASSTLSSLSKTDHLVESADAAGEKEYSITSLGLECLEALVADLNPEIRKLIDNAVVDYITNRK